MRRHDASEYRIIAYNYIEFGWHIEENSGQSGNGIILAFLLCIRSLIYIIVYYDNVIVINLKSLVIKINV